MNQSINSALHSQRHPQPQPSGTDLNAHFLANIGTEDAPDSTNLAGLGKKKVKKIKKKKVAEESVPKDEFMTPLTEREITPK
jgi:hypothetical protein